MEEDWQQPECVLDYLSRADEFPHRHEGEAVLLEMLPESVGRMLDLGCGDGRLLDVVLGARPGCSGVALDFSPPMLEKARARFEADEGVRVVEHDFSDPLPELGEFDAVVSGLAIHHLEHERKRELYGEIFGLLNPGGVFLNLDVVTSPTPALEWRFLLEIGEDPDAGYSPPDRPLDLQTQLRWLREIGFDEVDCYWKWLALVLLGGAKS